jgi:uncharacterized membrane protein YidH (DUF202 family)
MPHHDNRIAGVARYAWIRTALAIAALLLGLLALAVTLEGVSGRANAPTALTTLINLVTAVCGIAGAIGYGRGKQWGVYSFALSVGGHWVAHGLLLLSAIASDRLSPGAIVGLAVVPVIAVAILIGMTRQRAPITHDS